MESEISSWEFRDRGWVALNKINVLVGAFAFVLGIVFLILTFGGCIDWKWMLHLSYWSAVVGGMMVVMGFINALMMECDQHLGTFFTVNLVAFMGLLAIVIWVIPRVRWA